MTEAEQLVFDTVMEQLGIAPVLSTPEFQALIKEVEGALAAGEDPAAVTNAVIGTAASIYADIAETRSV
jgi:hypothetical protein